MKVSVSTAGIDEARRAMLRVANLPGVALARTAENVEEFVEGEAGKHSKKGDLVASIYLRRTGESYEIGHDIQRAPHAVFVHWGARPHKIEPKNKKALRWAGGGVFFFAKRINHPGNKADPWMVRAAAYAPREFDRNLQQLASQRDA